VEHAEHLRTPFPWRATTVVVGAVALVELVALIAIGFAQLAPETKAATKAAPTIVAPKPKPKHTPVTPQPLRARTAAPVLILNGNGISGAAAAEASTLQLRGYRIADAINAQRHDYANSMVMYVPGWVGEARRLARETGIRMVAPVDGLRTAQLRGSKLILLLGR
jgi:LytR cell envelope-related transcriptional attenuator